MAEPRPAHGRPTVDPARLAALRGAQGGAGRRRLRQPGPARRCCASTASTAATPRSPPSSPRARSARQGTYDAILARLHRPAAGKVEAKVLDALRLGTHQLLSMRVPAHAAISTTVDLVRDRVGAGRRRLRQRGAAQGRRSRTSPPGSPRSPPTRRPIRPRPSPQPPRVGRRRAARRPLGDATSSTPCSPPTTRAPRVTLVARPGSRRPRRAARASPRRTRRTAWCSRAATRARCRRSPRAAPGCRTRAPSWSRVALAAAPLDGPRRALARPVRRPGRQGGAARRARRRARRAAGRLERQPHRAGLVAAALRGRLRAWLGVVAADGTAPAVPPGVVRPGPGRRAVHRSGRAAATPGVALAPARPTTWSSWCCSSGRCSSAALDLVRPGGVVLYATCSPVLAETAGVVDAVLAGATT